MEYASFVVCVIGLGTLSVLLWRTLTSDTFRLWPTTDRDSWQHFSFWTLFRVGLGAVILTTILDWGSFPYPHWSYYVLGVPLMLAGFGTNFYGYTNLGVENTYGEKKGLVTTGLYRFSRNPQYVATIAGFIGLALVSNSTLSYLAAPLVVLVYALLAHVEEPWLRKAYGEAYDRYAETTPRFLSIDLILPKSMRPAREDTDAGFWH